MAVLESTRASILREVNGFASAAGAPMLLQRALAILGVSRPRPEHRDDILRLCRAFATEGGLVQEMAEEIARELHRN